MLVDAQAPSGQNEGTGKPKMLANLIKAAAGAFMALAMAALPLAAQVPSSEKNHESSQSARGPAAPLNQESSVLKIVKLKGSIAKVDLDRRTITIASKKKKDGEVELSFSQPKGREQIDASKKAAKLLGKKTLELEELKPGATVELSYYTSLMQVMDLVVDQPAR
jgi:hypothetical protein